MRKGIDSVMVWVGEDIHGMSNIVIQTSYDVYDGYSITKFNLGDKKVTLTFDKMVIMNVYSSGTGQTIIKPDTMTDGEFFKDVIGLEIDQFMDDVFNRISMGPYYEALDDLNYDLVDGNGLCISTIYEYLNGLQITSLRYSVVDDFNADRVKIVKFEDVKGLLSESDLEEITRYQLEIDEPEV